MRATSHTPRRRWIDWSGVAVFWLILAGAAVAQAAMSTCAVTATGSPDWWALAKLRVPPYILWMVATPLIVLVARRFRFERDRWARAAVAHAATAVAVVGVIGIGRAAIHDFTTHGAIAAGHQVREWFAGGFLRAYEADIFIYAAIAAMVIGMDAYRDAHERKRREAELRLQLDHARFDALRMQMQPHFLFNTLNTVSALVERDPAAARRVVARLSDILRRSLDRGIEQETTLAEELQFVRAYLDIEKLRFGDRIAVEIDVEGSLASSRVPSFVLQPLVENAILHGVAPLPDGGRVAIRASRRHGALVVEVADSGRGPDAPAAVGNGVALANVRQRLAALYGDAASLELRSGAESGCVAELTVPLDAEPLRDSVLEPVPAG